jgi:uncharacterized protein (DUF427 family)
MAPQTIMVQEQMDEDAAWHYPYLSAKYHVKDQFAFWHGVKVEE